MALGDYSAFRAVLPVSDERKAHAWTNRRPNTQRAGRAAM